MPEITLYRQVRRDGGKRMGIEIGGLTAFSHFDEGESGFDPSLVWYVDVRCAGPHLPQTRDGASEWLLGHADVITSAANKLADAVPVGSDH